MPESDLIDKFWFVDCKMFMIVYLYFSGSISIEMSQLQEISATLFV